MLSNQLTARIHAFATEAITAGTAVGLSVGIVAEGEIKYCAGFGVCNRDKGVAVTEHTLFHTASVTKPFVATAIMQLVELGKLRLDTPVSELLPYFALNDERAHLITPRHLLTHTAGLPNSDSEEPLFNAAFTHPEFDAGALERHVRSLSHIKLVSAPGERYGYSNFGYHILADIIAKTAGIDFADYIKAHVLAPLGMASSTFDYRPIPSALATAGHVRGGPNNSVCVSHVYPYHRAFEASSSLHSSAHELCQWARAQLRRGELNGHSVLRPESIAQMWHRHIPLVPESPEEGYRGLSWYLYDQYDRRVIAHHGGDVGFAALFQFFPDDNFAVVVLANTDWGVFDPGPIVDMACNDYFVT